MDVSEAISQRRSIRKFDDRPVPREMIEKMLHAATLAPSGKNAQPWRFIVLEGEKKDEVVDILERSVTSLKEAGLPTGSAEYSARTMRRAPVAIFVLNPRRTAQEFKDRWDQLGCLVDTQSVGAAIQNMLLQATALGLGTLWICDVFFADSEIGRYFDTGDELIAAVSVGYPAETPAPRPRKSWQEVTTWLGGPAD
ncbi:MAG: nitroreductase family protein [Bacillota bacterium]|jgi:nitroreductase